MNSNVTHIYQLSSLVYPLRRGLHTSQSQLCAWPPSSSFFNNNVDNAYMCKLHYYYYDVTCPASHVPAYNIMSLKQLCLDIPSYHKDIFVRGLCLLVLCNRSRFPYEGTITLPDRRTEGEDTTTESRRWHRSVHLPTVNLFGGRKHVGRLSQGTASRPRPRS